MAASGFSSADAETGEEHTQARDQSVFRQILPRERAKPGLSHFLFARNPHLPCLRQRFHLCNSEPAESFVFCLSQRRVIAVQQSDGSYRCSRVTPHRI
jgi:hypothetical protein